MTRLVAENVTPGLTLNRRTELLPLMITLKPCASSATLLVMSMVLVIVIAPLKPKVTNPPRLIALCNAASLAILTTFVPKLALVMVNTAELLNLDAGTIEPGKLADIDIIDGNPLPNLYDDIDEKTMIFSPNAQHTIFVAKSNGAWKVVIDGVEGPDYTQIVKGGEPIVQPDGSIIYYGIKADGSLNRVGYKF